MVDPHPDSERLMARDSEHSFQSRYSEENQITITRHISKEKYSTMCFKPLDNNMIDVTITNGEYPHSKHDLRHEYVTSQDIRQKYIGKAKLGVAVVFTLIFVMLAVVLYCLFINPAHVKAMLENGGTPLASTNETLRNSDAFPDSYVVNSTDSLNVNIYNASTTNV